jgi:hypothetical protein
MNNKETTIQTQLTNRRHKKEEAEEGARGIEKIRQQTYTKIATGRVP